MPYTTGYAGGYATVAIADVMGEIAAQLATIGGLRTFDYIPGQVPVPAAVVALPETYEYDGTYVRGMDRLTLNVYVLVGKVSDRAATATLAGYMNGTGATSVKQVLEAGTYTTLDSLRVMRVNVSTITVAAVDFLGATFEVDVVKQGSVT